MVEFPSGDTVSGAIHSLGESKKNSAFFS